MTAQSYTAAQLEAARENVARTVALCGRADLPFNALADADPLAVARSRIAREPRSSAHRADIAAWQEWLDANA
jgi:hypothetical protein